MGRRLRLCLAAAVAIAGSRVNAAAYVHEQKPITRQGSTASGNPLTAEFGDFVREQLEKWKVPGVALAVIDGDDVYTEVRAFIQC